MGRIAVLPDELVNKIAAGEVVERPASVVKELVENALDAGARTVRVQLRQGGLGLISVVDDGHGMSRADALLSLTRHATSKLRDLEGLFRIDTLGFRGEAVPAIAAVSRFRMVTAPRTAPFGTAIEMEGGTAPWVEDAPAVAGTRIEVADLFFNTPARRKFMRQPATELRHCEEALFRIALAHPEVGFFLEHEGRPLLSTPACGADLEPRIRAGLGPEARGLLGLEERRLGVALRGFLGPAELSFATARSVYTFVNRRYIRDRGLNAAVARALQQHVPSGRYPLLLLFVELDPKDVDVNVHPQKHEVRFGDPRGVYDAVSAALVRAAKGAAARVQAALEPGPEQAPAYALAVERFLARAEQVQEPGAALPVPADWEPSRPGFGQARPGINEAPPEGYFRALRYLGVLGGRFWVCEGRGGTLVVIDPHAARERAQLSALLSMGAGSAAQRALFCGVAELPPFEARLVSQRLASLEALGLEVEPFGANAFTVRAVPVGLQTLEAAALLTELCPALPARAEPSELLAARRVLACLAARQAGLEGSGEERSLLWEALERADFSVPARHPRIVLQELPLLELERRARGLGQG
jgi:DNA mismatch repair protein MutL